MPLRKPKLYGKPVTRSARSSNILPFFHVLAIDSMTAPNIMISEYVCPKSHVSPLQTTPRAAIPLVQLHEFDTDDLLFPMLIPCIAHCAQCLPFSDVFLLCLEKKNCAMTEIEIDKVLCLCVASNISHPSVLSGVDRTSPATYHG